MKKSEYLPYLRTLRRVPDDVILSVATREIEPLLSDTCICGWVVRESMALMSGSDASDIELQCSQTVPECHARFGGTYSEWQAVFDDIYTERGASVERAFVQRVMEAVS